MTPAFLYLMIAVGLIGAELLIMQFSLFWLFFLGLGALITSVVCWFVPGLGMATAAGLFLVSSTLVSAVLYAPLKAWQNKPAPIAGNDAIGQLAEVLEPFSEGKKGKVSWSGSVWPAIGDGATKNYAVGDMVKIVEIKGIHLIVASE
jgi:membrane protein implicated in regulation of membrane protease activity